MAFAKKSKNVVINFIGGPGTGKTTLAALTFAKLKSIGESTEFIPEYIKQLIYLKEFCKISDQKYISEYQYKLLLGAYEKIKYVITDAPLLHGIIYNKFHKKEDDIHVKLNKIICDRTNEFRNIFVLVERNPSLIYKENEGRIHNEIEAKKIDEIVIEVLENSDISYLRITPDNNCNKDCLTKIFSYMEKNE